MEFALVVPVTLPVEPLLPVVLAVESSRLNENLFGLRLRLATLSLTYCCSELKKLIVDAFVAWYAVGLLDLNEMPMRESDSNSHRFPCRPSLSSRSFEAYTSRELYTHRSRSDAVDWLDDTGRKAPRPRELSRFFASRYRFCTRAICNFVTFFLRDCCGPPCNLSHRLSPDALSRLLHRGMGIVSTLYGHHL